jgi:hypothetical protein
MRRLRQEQNKNSGGGRLRTHLHLNLHVIDHLTLGLFAKPRDRGDHDAHLGQDAQTLSWLWEATSFVVKRSPPRMGSSLRGEGKATVEGLGTTSSGRGPCITMIKHAQAAKRWRQTLQGKFQRVAYLVEHSTRGSALSHVAQQMGSR